MTIRVGFQFNPDQARLLIMLDALVKLNLLEMSRHKYPPLYKSGVVYEREPKAMGRFERWQTIKDLVEKGFGDCEDLAAARTAELRLKGIRARPWLKRYGTTWHVVVKYPDGRIEDPSKILGMNRKD